MAKQIFINLPVKDLNKSIEFFTKVGFTFNPAFTDENATCMIIGENIYSMLLVEKFFTSFTKKEIVDTTTSTEAIIAISLDSKEDVNAMADRAMAAGGKQSNDPMDHGWMYTRSFQDLDGHSWEVFFMDESKRPKNT